MNAADIRAWLASERDFAQGAALYAQVGTNATYQRLFGLGPSDRAHPVLVRELSALVAAEVPDVVPPPAAPAPAPPTAPAPEPAPTSAAAPANPALLDELAGRLRAVRDERSHLHPQLTARGTGQKRRQQLAGCIVALTHQEVGLLEQQAHARAHGRLPGPLRLDEVSDRAELLRRLTNLRCRRSKLKKDPARAAELARVQADIDLISTKLSPVSNG